MRRFNSQWFKNGIRITESSTYNLSIDVQAGVYSLQATYNDRADLLGVYIGYTKAYARYSFSLRQCRVAYYHGDLYYYFLLFITGYTIFNVKFYSERVYCSLTTVYCMSVPFRASIICALAV